MNILTYYHNLLVTLYEAKHLVACSACTTHRKSGLSTCLVSQKWDFMPITGAMDEQQKALVEGINTLKNIIENVEKRQEELRNILEKKIEQVEERYERVAGNFSLISQQVEDFEKKLLACGNVMNESKFVPAAALVPVPASPV
ncbi:hypothetical protein TNCV_1177111 [Trichonephila clavipes]|nr:hypothetical protein TNCV_1177111 [Trichonephila clavipes]